MNTEHSQKFPFSLLATISLSAEKRWGKVGKVSDRAVVVWQATRRSKWQRTFSSSPFPLLPPPLTPPLLRSKKRANFYGKNFFIAFFRAYIKALIHVCTVQTGWTAMLKKNWQLQNQNIIYNIKHLLYINIISNVILNSEMIWNFCYFIIIWLTIIIVFLW